MAEHVVAQEIGMGGGTPGGLTPPRPLPSIEGYELHQQIGETPASDLYLGAHTASGVLRTIAVQRSESDPAAVRRIVREVLDASRVKHPNVALVDGVGTTRDGRLYVATAHVPGTSLAELLQTEGHLPARRALQIALRATAALDAAHKLGVMHGDLTPEHIIVGPAGPDGLEPIGVTGFGMSTSRTGSAIPVAPSKQDRPYASPERVAGGAPDARSDVFSLASIMLHALSGNAPPPPRASIGRGSTPSSSAAIGPNARLAPAQVLLVARAAEPERRYPSAAVFRDTLAAAFGESDETTRRTPDIAHGVHEAPIVTAAAVATPVAPLMPVAVELSAALATPPRATPINPFLRPTPSTGTPAIAAPAIAASTAPARAPTPASAGSMRSARWDVAPAEMQPPAGLVVESLATIVDASPASPLAFGPPPVRGANGTIEFASAVSAPTPVDVVSVSPFVSSATPAAAVVFDDQPVPQPLPSTRPAPWTPARRRGAMIGGTVAASVVLGVWVLMRTPPAADIVAPGAAAAEAAEAAEAAAVSRPVVSGLPAAISRVAQTATDDAAKTTTVVPATGDAAAPTAPRAAVTVVSDKTAEQEESAATADVAPPMPRVVLPDVAMRGDLAPGDARLSQGALSEASEAGAAPQPAADGLVVDAATRAQIHAAMGRFARALESRDMGTLRQAYPSITVAERTTWSGFFRSAESIRARFTAQDFQVMPDGVDVNAVGKLTFYKRDTRQQTENAVTFRVLLTQVRGGGYVMKRIH